MAQDEAVAEITRVRESPRSETSEAMSDSGETTRVEPVEAASESDTPASGESQKEPSGGSSSSTSDLDGRGDNVDIVV